MQTTKHTNTEREMDRDRLPGRDEQGETYGICRRVDIAAGIAEREEG